MKHNHFLRFLTVLTCLVVCFFMFPAATQAAANAVVSVTVPEGSLQPGEQFSIGISVDPNNDIAGMQFNLGFDPDLVTVNSITEGNFLNQNGDTTYFSSGQINNVAGTVSGVFGAILNPGQAVASSGAFATITITAGDTAGTCLFSLSNVVIGDVDSQSVPVTLVNESIVIEGDDSPDDPSPAAPLGGSGGGGGGGGGGATDDKRFTTVSSSASADGVLWEEIVALSVDIKLELIIPDGTTVLNANGYPPSSITVATLGEPGESPDGKSIVGNVYNLTPEGITFEPYAILKMYYDESTLPDGVSEESLLITTRNPLFPDWQVIDGTIDTGTNCITSYITHFSDYTICAGANPAEFTVSQLALSSTEINPGGQATIDATVVNEGGVAGTYEANLEINGTVVETRNIDVNAGSSGVVTFTFSPDEPGQYVVRLGGQQKTVTVTQPLAPALFNITGLNVTPLRPSLGEPVTIEVAVRNIGDLAGTYEVAVLVDGVNQPARNIALDGSAAGTVSFSFTPETEGTHTAAIGQLIAPFEVIVLQSSPHAAVTTAPELDSFSVLPVYDEQTGLLSYSHIVYKLNQDWNTLDAQLFLNVFLDNRLIDQISLLNVSQLQDDGTGVLDFVPQDGWDAGEYSFSVELYSGDDLVQNTMRQLSVSPALSADVVSWKTMGIIIGIAVGIGLIIVGIVLYYRRDMLRGYR